ncbi:ribosome small subunit-dependent GTPase A [Desulfotruncus alcoholivorax]|uniref:ribosome small subunit-dependent GTPase A n=1 Tax=Desulfotruncus alcoholivorax TaxID=265477 RepID=UPI0004221D28|nr:ribosome small subunit-dependent GTPase A [Desulfotruncus alcoholivorax]
MKGTIIKSYGGFFFVLVADRVLRCKIRGRIRQHYGQVLVGDEVGLELAAGSAGSAGEGVITEVYPRNSELARPPVANVNQAVIIFSVDHPKPNTVLLDRFLLQAHKAGIDPVLCFNKMDLIDFGDLGFFKDYEPAGYPMVKVSAKSGRNIELLGQVLKGKISVLAGPSGVGKSSLLNALQPGIQLKTGDISHKLKRGRHTTRHVELIPLAGVGMVADTPGFSSIYLPAMRKEELAACYPEFNVYSAGCRFSGCLHYREPDCAVKEAVTGGLISLLRYQQYTMLLQEVTEAERRY